jgi:2',3'-cyclic-nucleotide 2'-phosphodiesterase (5'-nucleotidase family)
MRIASILLPLLLLTAAVAVAGAPRIEEGLVLADPAPSGESGLQARILFTSNTMGEFEPCSCPEIPLGGLSQLTGLVTAIRGEDVPAFWLDAGNRLFKLDMAMTDIEEAERRLAAMLLVDAASVAGMDASGVGRLDLGTGVSYLRALARRASYPVISANLVDDDGRLMFPPSVLLERGGVVVGVTSVLPGGLDGPGYTTTDAKKAARIEVASLRDRGAQLVVVLSNLGLDDDRSLARASKADLVLGSHSRDLTTEGISVGRAVVGQAGARGRYLGDARWYTDGPGRGPHLVLTTTPVLAAGGRLAKVDDLIEVTLRRLADPVLGLPPLTFESWDDPEFRRRQGNQ